MEKLKIGSNTFDLVPMGISEDSIKKTRLFKFISNSNYMDILTIVTNPNNYETVTIIGQDGNPQNTYADCVSFKGLNFEKNVQISDNETTDVYTVTYSIDAVERAISTLQTKLNNTQVLSDNAVGELTILIATLYGMLV